MQQGRGGGGGGVSPSGRSSRCAASCIWRYLESIWRALPCARSRCGLSSPCAADVTRTATNQKRATQRAPCLDKAAQRHQQAVYGS